MRDVISEPFTGIPPLSAALSETVHVGERLRRFLTPVNGLVAILDALGAKNYSEEEIFRFLDSRDTVLEKLAERARSGHIDKARLQFFTFGDTIVIVYRALEQVSYKDLSEFGLRMRAFMMHSLTSQILFRGAISLGRLYVDDASNTVMGAAVSDAADWYDRADWIGLQTTPHASMYIEAKLGRLNKNLDHVFFNYDVPLKGGGHVAVKAINWPKAFYVRGLRPPGRHPTRSMLLSLLAEHQSPRGTEAKFFNSIAFFDKVVEVQQPGKKKLPPGSTS
jgi:hypothetical protein